MDNDEVNSNNNEAEASPIRSFLEVRKRSVTLIVLPYLVGKNDATKTKVRSYLAFPYGVLTLATYVLKHSRVDVELEILDLNLHIGEDIGPVIESHLEQHNPDIVGISMMFDHSYHNVEDVSKQIKDFNEDIVCVLGGPAATTSAKEIIEEQPFLDAVCYSEGERALTELIESSNAGELLNQPPWVTRESVADARHLKTYYVENLNEVVDLDYGLINSSAYSMKEAFSPFATYRNEDDVRQFYIVTSRGCPFKCVFCSEPELQGASMRYADVDVLMAHVDKLVKEYGMNVLTFYDDQLLLDTDRAKELFRRLIPYNLRLEAPNGVTLHYIDEEMAGLMKAAGIDTIPLAIESGSDYVLRKVIKKPLRVQEIGKVVGFLREVGIFTQAFIVIGLPGEKDEHRLETLQVLKNAGLDWAGFSLATPVRGTELTRVCKEKGYIPKNLGVGDIVDKEYIINAPELGLIPEVITKQAYMMNLDVNFVNNRSMRMGEYDTAISCFSEVTERYDGHAFAHFYLAEAYEALGSEPEKVESNRKRFLELIEGDVEWQEYAEFFGLTGDNFHNSGSQTIFDYTREQHAAKLLKTA